MTIEGLFVNLEVKGSSEASPELGLNASRAGQSELLVHCTQHLASPILPLLLLILSSHPLQSRHSTYYLPMYIDRGYAPTFATTKSEADIHDHRRCICEDCRVSATHPNASGLSIVSEGNIWP